MGLEHILFALSLGTVVIGILTGGDPPDGHA